MDSVRQQNAALQELSRRRLVSLIVQQHELVKLSALMD